MKENVERKKFYKVLFNIPDGIFILVVIISATAISTGTNAIFSKSWEGIVSFFLWLCLGFILIRDTLEIFKGSKKSNFAAYKSYHHKLFRLIEFIFSAKTQKEIFEPLCADWQNEYFEALFKKEVWKSRWINVRYTHAFLAAMWQKSPIGDLIEFVIKIAKP